MSVIIQIAAARLDHLVIMPVSEARRTCPRERSLSAALAIARRRSPRRTILCACDLSNDLAAECFDNLPLICSPHARQACRSIVPVHRKVLTLLKEEKKACYGDRALMQTVVTASWQKLRRFVPLSHTFFGPKSSTIRQATHSANRRVIRQAAVRMTLPRSGPVTHSCPSARLPLRRLGRGNSSRAVQGHSVCLL